MHVELRACRWCYAGILPPKSNMLSTKGPAAGPCSHGGELAGRSAGGHFAAAYPRDPIGGQGCSRVRGPTRPPARRGVCRARAPSASARASSLRARASHGLPPSARLTLFTSRDTAADIQVAVCAAVGELHRALGPWLCCWIAGRHHLRHRVRGVRILH